MKQMQLGDTISAQTLESVQGERVRIPHPDQLTHLQFRRFAGCPICNLHLQSFVRRHNELAAHDVQEVVVFHSDQGAMKRHAKAPFAMLADPHKSLYKSFGVESSATSVLHPKAFVAALKGLWRHGAGLPSLGESPLGLPADFLIDRTGKIVAAKYGKHADDHWEVDEVLELVHKGGQD